MRRTILLIAVALTFSIGSASAQTSPQADASAITAALEAGEVQALIAAIRGKTFHLTPDENLKANQILLTYLSSLPVDDTAGRQEIGILLNAMLQAQVGGSEATSE